MFPTSAKALRKYSQTGLIATHQRACVIKSKGDALRISNRAKDFTAEAAGRDAETDSSFFPRTLQVLMQIQCSANIL